MTNEAAAVPSSEQKLPFELQGDEHVVLFCRRHWLYFYTKLAGIVLALRPSVGAAPRAGRASEAADAELLMEGAYRLLPVAPSALVLADRAMAGTP